MLVQSTSTEMFTREVNQRHTQISVCSLNINSITSCQHGGRQCVENCRFHLNTTHFFVIWIIQIIVPLSQILYRPQTHVPTSEGNTLLSFSAFTFVRGSGGEAACGGDVIIFML